MADKRRLNSIEARYDLDVSWHRDPWRTLRTQLSYLFAIGPIVACFVWLCGDHTAFESRCVSDAHRHLEQKCSNCHDRSFTPIMRMLTLDNSIHSTSDHKCVQCHRRSISDHLLAANQGDSVPQVLDRVKIVEQQVHGFSDLHCADCHDEHRGNATLTNVADALCTECHTKAHSQIAASQFQLDFHEFRRHPEFSIWNKPDPAKPVNPTKLVAWEQDEPVDQTKLRFSHHRHLDPELPSSDRNTTRLDCVSCHQPDLTGSYFRPINFEQHCHRCHKLGLPSTGELPHSKPEIIHGILLDRLKQEAVKARDNPVAQDPIGGPTKKPIDKSKADGNPRLDFELLVGEPLKKMEDLLFLPAKSDETEKRPRREGVLEAACTKCHFTEEGKDRDRLWKIVSPSLPEQWLKNGQFRHNRHFSIDCTACHTRLGQSSDPVKREDFYPLIPADLKSSPAIYASTSAQDVLMPRVGICQQCHDRSSGPMGRPLVSDKCVDCHAYHHTSGRSRPRTEILDVLHVGTKEKPIDQNVPPVPGAKR